MQGQYSEARAILETMPLNEDAQSLLKEIARMEGRRQNVSQRPRRSRQGVPVSIAILLLVVGLVAGGIGGFFLGRELLVREITFAFGTALSEFEFPTFEPFPTLQPLPTRRTYATLAIPTVHIPSFDSLPTVQPVVFPTLEPFPTMQSLAPLPVEPFPTVQPVTIPPFDFPTIQPPVPPP